MVRAVRRPLRIAKTTAAPHTPAAPASARARSTCHAHWLLTPSSPTRPVVDRDHDEVGQARGRRVHDRLVVTALIQLRVSHQHEHPGSQPPLSTQPVRDPTPSASPWPSEPLEIPTPGTRLRSGW
jgi:hypothetical protein